MNVKHTVGGGMMLAAVVAAFLRALGLFGNRYGADGALAFLLLFALVGALLFISGGPLGRGSR